MLVLPNYFLYEELCLFVYRLFIEKVALCTFKAHDLCCTFFKWLANRYQECH